MFNPLSVFFFQTNDGARSWERPWSLEEMRKGAGNWSLAGDAGVRPKILASLDLNLCSQETTKLITNQLACHTLLGNFACIFVIWLFFFKISFFKKFFQE